MTEYDVGTAFQAIENELIQSMMRNMNRHRAEETAAGIEWSMWQAEQLKALEKYKRENQKRYGKQFRNINKEMGEMIRQARQTGSMQQEIRIMQAIRRGFKVQGKNKGPSHEAMSAAFFKLNDRKLEALITSTTHDMGKAETAILRMADDEYRKTIFNAQAYANSGAGTYEKAVDMATRDMLSRGLNCIEYKNGARHTLPDYAEMAIRTASKRAYLHGEGEKRREWGIATVIVNKRGNPCPRCLPFVGKVLIDDVWSGGTKSDGPYPLMSTAIAAGLYHPRCKDSHTTYFPGISTADDKWTKDEIEAIDKNYQRDQKQQYVMRQADKYRRLSEYSLDPGNKSSYTNKEKDWKRRLAKHQNSDIINTEGWSDDAIERRRLDEASIAGHKSEYAILYDSRGNKIFKKHGDKHEVEYSDVEWNAMPGGVLTHNHPSGATFSTDDIYMLYTSGIKELRAVGRDGVYVMRRPHEWPFEINTMEKITDEYKSIMDELELEIRRDCELGIITNAEDYVIEYQSRVLNKFVRRHDLEYFIEGR